jgi:hypothetical protein
VISENNSANFKREAAARAVFRGLLEKCVTGWFKASFLASFFFFLPFYLFFSLAENTAFPERESRLGSGRGDGCRHDARRR